MSTTWTKTLTVEIQAARDEDNGGWGAAFAINGEPQAFGYGKTRAAAIRDLLAEQLGWHANHKLGLVKGLSS